MVLILLREEANKKVLLGWQNGGFLMTLERIKVNISRSLVGVTLRQRGKASRLG